MVNAKDVGKDGKDACLNEEKGRVENIIVVSWLKVWLCSGGNRLRLILSFIFRAFPTSVLGKVLMLQSPASHAPMLPYLIPIRIYQFSLTCCVKRMML